MLAVVRVLESSGFTTDPITRGPRARLDWQEKIVSLPYRKLADLDEPLLAVFRATLSLTGGVGIIVGGAAIQPVARLLLVPAVLCLVGAFVAGTPGILWRWLAVVSSWAAALIWVTLLLAGDSPLGWVVPVALAIACGLLALKLAPPGAATAAAAPPRDDVEPPGAAWIEEDGRVIP